MITPEKIKLRLKMLRTIPFTESPAQDALEYIRQLEAALPKWIDVKDRLPDDRKDVLVCVRGETIDTGYYVSSGAGRGCWEVYSCMSDDVTHWMQLPELPKAIT